MQTYKLKRPISSNYEDICSKKICLDEHNHHNGKAVNNQQTSSYLIPLSSPQSPLHLPQEQPVFSKKKRLCTGSSPVTHKKPCPSTRYTVYDEKTKKKEDLQKERLLIQRKSCYTLDKYDEYSHFLHDIAMLSILPSLKQETEIGTNSDEVSTCDFSYHDLHVMPVLSKPLLKKLDLSHNSLESISVLKFDHLYWLDISHNSLHWVPKLLLKSLKYLDLSHNLLTQLPVMILDQLQYLDASFNLLQKIPPILPCALEDLNLSNNSLNFIQTVYLSRLWKLDLSNNQLPKFPIVHENLHILCLSKNKIKSTNVDEELVHLKNLQDLNLDHNYLSVFPKNISLTLEILSLNDNQITNCEGIPKNNIKKLMICFNPLDTDSIFKIKKSLPAGAQIQRYHSMNAVIDCQYCFQKIHT